MPGDLLLEAPLAPPARATSWRWRRASGPRRRDRRAEEVLLYNPQKRELLGACVPRGLPKVLKCSRSGKLLLVAGGVGAKSGKAVLFDVETGNRITEVGDEFDSVLAADISPDQSVVALGGSDKMVKIYSTANGALVGRIKKHTEWVTAIAFSADGVLLASGDRNGGLRVWEGRQRQRVLRLAGHTMAVTERRLPRETPTSSSAPARNGAKLWDMASGNLIKELGRARRRRAVGRLRQRRPHVSSGRDNQIRSWAPDGNALKT